MATSMGRSRATATSPVDRGRDASRHVEHGRARRSCTTRCRSAKDGAVFRGVRASVRCHRRARRCALRADQRDRQIETPNDPSARRDRHDAAALPVAVRDHVLRAVHGQLRELHPGAPLAHGCSVLHRDDLRHGRLRRSLPASETARVVVMVQTILDLADPRDRGQCVRERRAYGPSATGDRRRCRGGAVVRVDGPSSGIRGLSHTLRDGPAGVSRLDSAR